MPDFDSSLPMMLHRALDAIMPPYRELFARFDLTEQQWRVMRVLWTSRKVTSQVLANRTLLAAPSLVGVIDRLEKKQLVTRVRSTDDRRVVHIIATAKGRALERKVTPEVDQIHAGLKKTVSRAEWKAMEKTLERIQIGSNTVDSADVSSS